MNRDSKFAKALIWMVLIFTMLGVFMTLLYGLM